MYPILQNRSILDQALFMDQKVTGDGDFASLRGSLLKIVAGEIGLSAHLSDDQIIYKAAPLSSASAAARIPKRV
jgi:hypothetical protein